MTHAPRRGLGSPGRFSVRRPLGALLAFACVAAMTVSGPWLAQSRPVPGSPNIVVFLTDDQRWDSLSVMPALQAQLVRRGRLFTDAMVPTSLCCPSRATILSGRYAHHTTVCAGMVSPEASAIPIASTAVTLVPSRVSMLSAESASQITGRA